jgi:hypothetical protein
MKGMRRWDSGRADDAITSKSWRTDSLLSTDNGTLVGVVSTRAIASIFQSLDRQLRCLTNTEREEGTGQSLHE